MPLCSFKRVPCTETDIDSVAMTADLAPTPSAASGTSASRVKSSTSIANQPGYPRGHLGHLSGKEETALVQFKEVLEQRGAWKRGPPASLDDQTLL